MTASAEPSQLDALPDHANEIDTRALAIDKVGIKDLAYPIKILDRDKEIREQHEKQRTDVVRYDQKYRDMHKQMEDMKERKKSSPSIASLIKKLQCDTNRGKPKRYNSRSSKNSKKTKIQLSNGSDKDKAGRDKDE